MSRKPNYAPEFFGQLWLFIKDRNFHVSLLREESNDVEYSPWSTFATGSAIFISLLAADAARSVHFFDEVVTFTMVICSSLVFVLVYFPIEKLLHRKSSFSKLICGGEYLVGFLTPLLTLGNFSVIGLLNCVPGIRASLGFFTLNYDLVVPTTTNRLLVAISISFLIGGILYASYRIFFFLRDLEQLKSWQAALAMSLAIAAVVLLNRQIEFWARIFSGELHNIWNVLGGTQGK